MTPVIIMAGTTAIATICLYIIVFNYYTMIFDQINKQFDLICNEMSKLFNRRQRTINKVKQRQLINLINQHNQAAIEIQKINELIKNFQSINFSLIE